MLPLSTSIRERKVEHFVLLLIFASIWRSLPKILSLRGQQILAMLLEFVCCHLLDAQDYERGGGKLALQHMLLNIWQEVIFSTRDCFICGDRMRKGWR